MKTSQEIQALRRALLSWYDREGRTLPWRIRPEDRAAGVITDPYKIWLSEIMCQQTVIKAATPYWLKFLERWPAVSDLAGAPQDDVLAAWAGLGYYARARNLHKCAQMVCEEHNGVFPVREADLLKLPGIGPYTAAAIAAICSGEATNVVDGNVERVICRLRTVEAALPKSRPEIRALAGKIADPKRPGDYAQALMDLGAIVCKPKNPKCDICVWRFACRASKQETAEKYPVRQKKAKRPVRYGTVFYLERGGEILVRRRPETGLLGGMMELPGTEWGEGKLAKDVGLASAPVRKNWQLARDPIKHVFTHFTLYLDVYSAEIGAGEEAGGAHNIWAALTNLDKYALPSVMRKAISRAQETGETA